MIAIGSEDRWHLQLAQRWILQYNFYINDQRWGRMFVRMSPYLPFSARVWRLGQQNPQLRLDRSLLSLICSLHKSPCFSAATSQRR
jgi:hypothetical protein